MSDYTTTPSINASVTTSIIKCRVNAYCYTNSRYHHYVLSLLLTNVIIIVPSQTKAAAAAASATALSVLCLFSWFRGHLALSVDAVSDMSVIFVGAGLGWSALNYREN